MKKILIILLFLFGFLNAGIVNKTTIQKAQGQGYGATYEEALNKALSDAVGRMYGANLSSRSEFNINSVKHNKKRDFKKIYNEKIKKSTSGKFNSYDVLSRLKTSDGYKVKVLIKNTRSKKYYKTPGLSPNGRRRIAVIPSYSSKTAFNILGTTYYQKKVTNHLTQEVVNAITQTRKFTVLDREASQAYNQEKNLILRDGARDELVKIGQVLGTDYLYVLNVSSYSLEKDRAVNDLIGEVSDDVVANATIEYRIVVMATRQIKYSNTKNFSVKVKGTNNDQYFLNSLKTIAKSLTDDIMNNIYPVKIAGVSGSEVILSQKLNMGDKYDVFSLGKKIYDSYTKEAVGYDERKVGTIEITRVNPKMSYAKIISGSAKKGNLCRLVSSVDGNNKTQRPDVTEEEKPSDVEIIQGGGVLLPMD